MSNQNIDLVIARYKENIDWLYTISQINSIKNIFIYEKSQHYINLISSKYKFSTIPNFGRESNTYLHYIVENYHNLNDYTIFLQGDPHPHCRDLEHKIKSISIEKINRIRSLSPVTTENEASKYRYHKSHPYGLFLGYFMDLLFDIDLDLNQTVKVTYGAQFCVPKEVILYRPIEFYEYLLKIVSRKTNGIEPYIFERLWLYIFDPDIRISDVYKTWIKIQDT